MALDDEVESDQSDYSRNRWAATWQSAFFTVFSIVMVISVFLYMCLVRAVANNKTKETPIYFFLILFFFTSLVEDAIVIQQFIMVHHTMVLNTFLCQFFTYVVYGNKILQAMAVLAMLFYTWLYLELKNVRVEKWTKRFFPFMLVGLFIVELFLVIWPTINVRGSMSGQHCYRVDDSFATQRKTGWLYLVLFPYFIPLLISIFPFLRMSLLMQQNKLARVQSTNLKIALVTGISFFFFHLLYYTLMLGREAEALIFNRPEWRRILGLHVWYITRPMFALIAYGWHIVLPLAPFAFDEDLFDVFPGNLINRNRLISRDEETRNSISMSETASMSDKGKSDLDSGNFKITVTEDRDRNGNRFENPLHEAVEHDSQEFNQSVV